MRWIRQAATSDVFELMECELIPDKSLLMISLNIGALEASNLWLLPFRT